MCNKMSDVRLSNASPTLERVDARQADNVRPPVSRNLFGSADPGEIRRYLEAAIQEDVQSFMHEYDFDPVNDRPLTPRNFEWQEVTDAAEFYHRPPHGSRRPQRRGADAPGEENREGSSGEQPGTGAERDGSRKRRSGSCSSERLSKRSHTDEDDDEDQSDGAASLAVEERGERESRPDSCAEVQ